jgi:hypothetical protein
LAAGLAFLENQGICFFVLSLFARNAHSPFLVRSRQCRKSGGRLVFYCFRPRPEQNSYPPRKQNTVHGTPAGLLIFPLSGNQPAQSPRHLSKPPHTLLCRAVSSPRTMELSRDDEIRSPAQSPPLQEHMEFGAMVSTL